MNGSLGRAGAAALAAVLTLGLAGCVTSDYTYVRDSSGQAYFKVPSTWQKVNHTPIVHGINGTDPDSATARLQEQLIWGAAFDGSTTDPGPQNFIPTTPAAGSEPFVYATSWDLTERQRDAVSLNMLRNQILPVTADLRAQYEQLGADLPFSQFELLADEVLDPGGGAQGVHVRYNYRIRNAGMQTFDQTVFLTSGGTRVALLLIRCSPECYERRGKELDAIAKSFKIKPTG